MQHFITFAPSIRRGQAIVAGTRLAVADVLSYLAAGMSFEQIIDDFPELDADKIKACLERHAKQ